MKNDHDHDHSIERKYGATVDSEILGNYSNFLSAAEDMLGRKLNVTTGGKSDNHLRWKSFVAKARKYYGVNQKQVDKGSKKSKSGNTINQALIDRAAKMMSKASGQEYTRGAIDIGIGGNSLTNEEVKKLGVLGLKHGLRVGDELNHLHFDQNMGNHKTARIFTYNQNTPKNIRKPTKWMTDEQKQAQIDAQQDRIRTNYFQNFLDRAAAQNVEWNKAADAATIESEKTRLMEPKEAARKQFLSNLANMKI